MPEPRRVHRKALDPSEPCRKSILQQGKPWRHPEHCRRVIHRLVPPRNQVRISERGSMKRVAVLGGGPAGAFAAERLARSGMETVVLDEKLAWEKPCGGGLTYKAYRDYPFLIENNTPKKFITETCLAAPKSGSVRMGLG